MQSNSKLIRFVLVSPLFLFLFFIMPGTLILVRLLHIHLPFSFSVSMLLGNNICLLIGLIVRLQHYLAGLRHGNCYGSDLPRSTVSLDLERSMTQVRDDLSRDGYCFDDAGTYGEKRDLGYLGMALIYGGLVVMLSFGVWDNLRQFSGTVYQGPGKPTELYLADKYYHLITGPLASPAGLPLMKVMKQAFPGSSFPMGNSEIALLSKDGKRIGGATLVPGEAPYRYKEFEFYLGKLAVDYALVLRTRDSFENNVFDDAVKLFQLPAPKDGFTHYGTFTTPAGDEGETWYDPAKNSFRISLTHKGTKIIDTDFAFQSYREKLAGDYVVSVKGMGHWSEIHIVRSRHMTLIIAGGVVALLGLLIRVLFRPQRVWLEEKTAGCRVQYVGKNPSQLSSLNSRQGT